MAGGPGRGQKWRRLEAGGYRLAVLEGFDAVEIVVDDAEPDPTTGA